MLSYLDAGSGSMIAGAIAAGAAGVGVAVRAGLSKFKRKPKGAATDAGEQPAEQSSEQPDAAG